MTSMSPLVILSARPCRKMLLFRKHASDRLGFGLVKLHRLVAGHPIYPDQRMHRRGVVTCGLV